MKREDAPSLKEVPISHFRKVKNEHHSILEGLEEEENRPVTAFPQKLERLHEYYSKEGGRPSTGFAAEGMSRNFGREIDNIVYNEAWGDNFNSNDFNSFGKKDELNIM